ncbi:50S ribosomal protein L15e [Candidatus Pacearchaeota archaeon]|nr:50S ribosomal protein L15e [Candidatus Pacearchaeota archaeon]
MAKGLYQAIREAWKKPDPKRVRELMVEWRKENAAIRVERPTRLDRARSLGYKAKKGYIIVRIRVIRGGRKRHRTNKGRRSKRHTIKKVVKMSYQWVCEGRAQKKFPNMEVLNSYYLAKDGKYIFYEVILVDPERKEIKTDKKINWITKSKNQGRVNRGLTSAAKKSRGLRSKSPMNKNRPSVRAGKRRGK